MKNISNGLMNFIDNTPNAYYCVENIKKQLLDNGFTELYENDSWDWLNPGNYFVTKNDSSIIAFKTTGNGSSKGFNIVGVHTDSPSFSIKHNPEMFDGYYLKFNTNSYGGMINYSWFDRPLSIAGRLILKNKDIYKKKLVNIDKDLLVIPSQAVHINRDVNNSASFNRQNDLLPVISLENGNLTDMLGEYIDNNDLICDYDLYLYNRDKAKLIGLKDEMILAPRTDDLACVYPSLLSFMDSDNPSAINVFCAFNNEEIGSLTEQGADSPFLINTLDRIAKMEGLDFYQTLGNSFIISADNAHAIHPNAPSKSDPTNIVRLNGGVVIKHHPNYTTDGISSTIFKEICAVSGIKYQDFYCRSDMVCGSTIGGLTQSHVPVDAVDVGLPQLAMHSANETIGSKDVIDMYDALHNFYNCAIKRDKGNFKILYKE